MKEGWAYVWQDNIHEHYFMGDLALCHKYRISGLYVLTPTPHSLPPCDECLEILHSEIKNEEK